MIEWLTSPAIPRWAFLFFSANVGFSFYLLGHAVAAHKAALKRSTP